MPDCVYLLLNHSFILLILLINLSFPNICVILILSYIFLFKSVEK